MAWRGYNPDTDVPSLSGKVILVTGGTAGIGRATVLGLARHAPAHVLFTGRNRAAAAAVVAECEALPVGRVDFLECDHGSLASVAAAADAFLAAAGPFPRLDIFIANAGVYGTAEPVTVDGYEGHFGINHLGNAALLLRLLPVMLRTAAGPGADVRFVSVSSVGHRVHPPQGIDFDSLRAASSTRRLPLLGRLALWRQYGQSKLAGILFAAELSRRHPQLTSVAIDPGLVRTALTSNFDLTRRIILRLMKPCGLLTASRGSYNSLWAATHAAVRGDVGKGAVYFVPVGVCKRGSSKCWDNELARKLWDWTVKETGFQE